MGTIPCLAAGLRLPATPPPRIPPVLGNGRVPRPERSAALSAFDAELTLALGPLTAFARSLGSDPERAEELASATVAVALERRTSFDATRALRPWLCGILVRLHGRASRRHLPLAEDLPAADSFDPSLALEREELARLLADALPGLTAADRAVQLRLELTLREETGRAWRF